MCVISKSDILQTLEDIDIGSLSNLDSQELDNIIEQILLPLQEMHHDINIPDTYQQIWNVLQEYNNTEDTDDDNDTDDDYTDDDNDISDNLITNINCMEQNGKTYTSLSSLENELHKALIDIKDYKLNILREQVKYLKTVLQPEQRSAAWFEMRKHMCTASDIAAIIGKCKYRKPVEIVLKKCGYGKFTGNKATRHGQCFEDVATAIYMSRRNVEILEFGLIPHPTISILGASPDGISTDGVMLEIKCPYSRKINGNVMDPKTYGYWIQMQIQLEVCNLEECDFLECEIEKYKCYEDYENDKYDEESTIILNILPKNETTLNKNYVKVPNDRRSSNGLEKGMLGKIYNKVEKICTYLYPPFDLTTDEQILWIKKYVDKLDKTKFDTFGKIYWKLNISSVVSVPRDKQWFAEIKPILYKFWEEVERRRIIGCEDILPKKRKVKKVNLNFYTSPPKNCLMSLTSEEEDSDDDTRQKPKKCLMNLTSDEEEDGDTEIIQI